MRSLRRGFRFGRRLCGCRRLGGRLSCVWGHSLATAAIAKEKNKARRNAATMPTIKTERFAAFRTFFHVSHLIGHGDFLNFRLFNTGDRRAAPTIQRDIGSSVSGMAQPRQAAASARFYYSRQWAECAAKLPAALDRC